MRVFIVCLLIWFVGVYASAQSLPTIRVKANRLIMYLNNERGNFNGINDLPNPFSYSFGTEQPTSTFALVAERDSIVLTLQHGVTADVQLIRETKGDTVLCHFSSHKLVKAAVFNDSYKKANEGKTIVDVPEVYELINVIFALTAYGNTEAIHKDSDYYREVIAHFTPYKTHRAVQVVDSLLTKSNDNYPNLKMDSYAYVFKGAKIVNGGVYDRVSWGEFNELAPYVLLLEQFAEQSHFRAFFQKHKPYYQSLINDFQKNINVATMKAWLEKQFPSTHYSAVKVLFSPLVGWNQSANHFEDNKFTEAQMHINFPFVDASQQKQSPNITRGQRMRIAFTELNHSYLNLEAEKYTRDISTAFGNLSEWSTPGKPSASYNNPLACFEEYVNHALVTLLYHDIFDQKTAETLRSQNEKGMVMNRGFQRFKEFNQEFLRLYQQKKPGQTVADLYPAILAWAATQ